MKKCPQCQTNYYDNMLDFCLEDGARLLLTIDDPEIKREIKTPPGKTAFQELSNPLEPTVAFFSPLKDTQPEIETIAIEKKETQKPLQLNTEKIKHTALGHWTNFLETAPIVLALMHNYWQWLYLLKLSYSGFVEYFLSYSFLIWLLLLVCGLTLSIISFKYGQSRKFAVVALVVLAINVLLYIVPK